MDNKELKKQVKEFWEREPCGSGAAQATRFTREYFDEIEENRYRLEPFIHRFAQFSRQRGKKVLEVGVGAGTDHLQFARAGAHLSGIDITDVAVDMVTKRLALEGLSSDLRRSDAENLPFADNSFDYVYSWGVLHHTPDTVKSIDEVYRVCRPGRKTCIMLYHRRSIVAWMFWLRYAMLRLRPFRTLRDVIFNHMESIGTKCYTIREARYLFSKFQRVTVTPVLTPYDTEFIPTPFARCIPASWGWFLVVEAEK